MLLFLYTGLPPQPSGTVTATSATSYRITNIAGAVAGTSYVVWSYPTTGNPATNPYTRVELPLGTTQYDVTGLTPSAEGYQVALYTVRNGLQSDPAVLVFDQGTLRMYYN